MKKLLTPLKAIRKRCLDCSETTTDIKNCPFDGIKSETTDELCPLFPFRMGKGEGKGSRLRAIRKYCLWCVCDSSTEVRLCPSKDCPLYIYRLGRNPRRKGIGGNPEMGFKSKNSVVELDKIKGSGIGNRKIS